MGREIRRVPPNWEHPMNDNGAYRPMFDKSATDAFNSWFAEFVEFKKKELDEVCAEYSYDRNDPYSAFCDYNGYPPNSEYYRPAWDEDTATWWQVYETVSEGTPVTPPFETPEELIDYLVENGDFWDQKRRAEGRAYIFPCDPWPREQAEKFVRSGFAVSMVVSDGKVMSGVEAL